MDQENRKNKTATSGANTPGGGVFRQKSLDRISSPEDLDDYVKVANPGVWMILGAVIVLLIGIFVWAAEGTLETRIDALCLVDGNGTLCYISESNIGKVEVGMKVTLSDGTECKILGISSEARLSDDVMTDYAQHLAGFAEGEWIHGMAVDLSLPGGIYSAKVTIDEIHPIKFIFN